MVAIEEDHVAAVDVELGKLLSGIRSLPELVVVCCDGDENGGWLR